MKTLRRLIPPLIILASCLTLVFGSAYAYFVVTSEDVLSFSGSVGFIDVDLTDSFFEEPVPSAGVTEFRLDFSNYSTLAAQFEVYFVIVWQEETPPGSGDFVDLTLPVDEVEVVVEGSRLSGHVYHCVLQPSDGSSPIDFTLEGEVDWTSYLGNPDYANKVPKINVYFNADYA